MFTTDNEKSDFDLQPCKSCGRQFHVEILSRHFPICQKVKSKPRKLSFEKSGQLKRTDFSICNEVEVGEIVNSDGATLEDQKTIDDNSEHNHQQNNAENSIFIGMNLQSKEEFQKKIFERDVLSSKQLFTQKMLKQGKSAQEGSNKPINKINSSIENQNKFNEALRTGRSRNEYLIAKREFVNKSFPLSKIPKSTLWKSPQIYLEPIQENSSKLTKEDLSKNEFNDEEPPISKNNHGETNQTSNDVGTLSHSRHKPSNYCFECGFKFSHDVAKFCSKCGTHRLIIKRNRE